jgi:hypothetical protein
MPKSRFSIDITDIIIFSTIFALAGLWINPVVYYSLPRYEASGNLPAYPGQGMDAAASFLITSTFGNAWAGAFLIAAVLSAVCGLAGLLLRMQGGYARALRYLPAIIMLLNFVQPMHFFSDGLSIIAALGLMLLYQATARAQVIARTGLFLVLGSVLFSCAPNGFLVFASMGIIFEIARKRNFAAAVGQGVIAASIPAIATICIFPSYTIPQAYALVWKTVLPNSPFALLHLALLLYFPCGFALMLVMKGRSALLSARKPSGRGTGFQGVIVGATMAVLAAIALWAITTSDFHRNASMQCAMLAENWDRIIAIGEKIPPASLTVVHTHLIDRALYKKGRLLDDLCKFPQNQRALLLDVDDNKLSGWSYFWKHACAGWTYYDLGWVNGAENSACEAATQGYRPALLLLSRIYAIKGMPDAARICLGKLAQDPAYRRRARELSSVLAADSALSANPDVRQVRSIMLKADRLQSMDSPLDLLISENPGNRMAFEYRIALHLMRGELDSIATAVPKFRALGYPRLPRLCEEALMLREMVMQKEPELYGYALSRETVSVFKNFFSILLTKHGGQAKNAYHDLTKYRDSYFFYCTYFMKPAGVNR